MALQVDSVSARLPGTVKLAMEASQTCPHSTARTTEDVNASPSFLNIQIRKYWWYRLTVLVWHFRLGAKGTLGNKHVLKWCKHNFDVMFEVSCRTEFFLLVSCSDLFSRLHCQCVTLFSDGVQAGVPVIRLEAESWSRPAVVYCTTSCVLLRCATVTWMPAPLTMALSPFCAIWI